MPVASPEAKDAWTDAAAVEVVAAVQGAHVVNAAADHVAAAKTTAAAQARK